MIRACRLREDGGGFGHASRAPFGARTPAPRDELARAASSSPGATTGGAVVTAARNRRRASGIGRLKLCRDAKRRGTSFAARTWKDLLANRRREPRDGDPGHPGLLPRREGRHAQGAEVHLPARLGLRSPDPADAGPYRRRSGGRPGGTVPARPRLRPAPAGRADPGLEVGPAGGGLAALLPASGAGLFQEHAGELPAGRQRAAGRLPPPEGAV